MTVAGRGDAVAAAHALEGTTILDRRARRASKHEINASRDREFPSPWQRLVTTRAAV